MSSKPGSGSSQNKPYDVPYDPDEAARWEAAPIGTTDTYSGAASAHSAKSAAAQSAAHASDAASRAAGSAQNAASRTASDARSAASQTAQKANAAADELADRFQASGKTDVGSGSGHGVPGQTGNPVYDAADRIGQSHGKSTQNPSAISSGGAVGSKFNPDGPIGSIAEKVGGPFAKDGVIGRQFDAAGGGIAGTIEKLVDGPSQKKPGDAGYKGPASGSSKK
jgi:pyruvate/2-oxoglutarate dehydrogenase complex dihydrolipoamide acyltransferase (E2) component